LKLLHVLCFSAFVYYSQAQDTLMTRNLSAAFLDAKGMLYTGEEDGTVRRYVQNGDELLYGPPRPARVSLIDASNPLRIFLFYEDLQEYVLLDRFLTETARYELAGFTTYAGLCAPSQNNLIWLVDLQTFNLRKIDPSGVINEITIPLQQVLDPENSDITFLREYQNLLFLSDRLRGVYVFDNLGNLLTQVNRKGILHISFSGDEALMLMDSTELLRYDLYSGNIRTEILPVPANYYFENGKKYFIDDRSVITIP